jgi:hypothetical protein
MRGKARSRHESSPRPAIAGDGIDMTALEIVAVTAGVLLVGYLALSEFRIDFSQRSHMKRLIAEGYARLRAARYRRQSYRRVHRKRKLREAFTRRSGKCASACFGTEVPPASQSAPPQARESGPGGR